VVRTEEETGLGSEGKEEKTTEGMKKMNSDAKPGLKKVRVIVNKNKRAVREVCLCTDSKKVKNQVGAVAEHPASDKTIWGNTSYEKSGGTAEQMVSGNGETWDPIRKPGTRNEPHRRGKTVLDVETLLYGIYRNLPQHKTEKERMRLEKNGRRMRKFVRAEKH